MSLYNSVEQFETDAALAHQIIHGDENTTVLTEGGPVDSFAKLLKYLRDTVTNEFDLAEVIQQIEALQVKPVAAPVQMVTASRALVLDDASRYLAAESADGVTLTVPAQASVTWPANVEIHIQQIGAGQVTISPATGVEIISEETLKTRKQGSPLTLKRLGENKWTVLGSLEAAG
tara:strand:- start:20614 stop:21138 length:525 start_codon:yes stop_codon:yes gene_type:complete